MKLQWIALFVASLLSNSLGNAANKHKPWIEAKYQGIVMENDRTVLLNPPLFAIDKDAPLHYAGEICGFKIHGQNVPFEAVVLDKMTGEGLVRAKEPVDCEAQREHAFTIQAHDCGQGPDKVNMKRSHKAQVHVRVNDVNEFVPVFAERLYRASAAEGRWHERVLKVEAVDGDCSPQYSQICFYQILTPGVPFSIDNDGNIKNTEKLDVKKESLYTFTVTAYDCGKKRASEDAQVQIVVKPTCTPAWQGWNKRIQYIPGTGSKPLFPRIRLETCDEAIWNIQASVELQTNHIGKGCDRDNYSERTLRKLCGAIPGAFELLPAPGAQANWTYGLSSYYSQDSSQIYWFNGSQAVALPAAALRPGLADHFTLSYWLKHGAKARKEVEALICNTLATDAGFAHYSLTVHGCRLTFLYWPELRNARPMKFLWRLEQVCDDEWHHYALNLQFPTVTLFVDGVTYDPALIHDSGLLRPPQPEVRLIVAACWQDEVQRERTNSTDSSRGRTAPEVTLDRYLQGFVAGFTIRPGALESRDILECLYACKEGLDFSDFESLGKGMKVHINPSQTLLTLEGDNLENFNRAIEHVTYRNALRFATPGIRPLKLFTSVKCFSEEACVDIPPVEGYVVVLQPDAPRITLSGAQHLAHPAADVEGPGGIELFPDLHITCSIAHDVDPTATEDNQSAVQDSLISDEIIHNLDSCEIFILGEELNPQQESLFLDQTLVQQKGLDVSNSSSILTVSGVETIAVYELVLRGVRYQVRPGAALYERKFRLVCAEMNGRYISNEFSVEVNVLHSLRAVIHPNQVRIGQQFLHPAHQDQSELTGHSVTGTHRNSVIPGAATIIIVVCVGFLVLMAVLGIFRIQTIHQHGSQDPGTGKDRDTFWDDSALTIIVNPMESYENRQGDREAGGRDPLTPGSEAEGGGQERHCTVRSEGSWEPAGRRY